MSTATLADASSVAMDHDAGYGEPSRNAYNDGCRCGACRAASSRDMTERRRQARERFEAGEVTDVRHGTLNTYRYYGCRCDSCKAAQSVANAAYKRAKPRSARVDWAGRREHRVDVAHGDALLAELALAEAATTVGEAQARRRALAAFLMGQVCFDCAVGHSHAKQSRAIRKGLDCVHVAAMKRNLRRFAQEPAVIPLVEHFPPARRDLGEPTPDE